MVSSVAGFRQGVEASIPALRRYARALTRNTDIADEFSKMIITQQAYSANTKVISTAQEMLRDVFNIIR